METSDGRAREPRLRRRIDKVQLLGLVVLVLVVLFAFANKVGAQPGGGKGGGAAAAAAKLKPAEVKAAAAKPAGDAADAKAGDKPEAPADKGEAAGAPAEEAGGKHAGAGDEDPVEQLKSAVLVDPSKGGVPIHKEGGFRSPFASPNKPPVHARVGLLLETVEEFDIKKGAFTAHFYLSLTSDKPMPSKIDLKPTNGKIDEKDTLADLPTFKMWKVTGTFHVQPDLHAYPFDTQELDIELEDDSNGQDVVTLHPDVDHTFLDAGFNVPGWDTSFVRARILTHYYPDRFDNDDLYYSRFMFTLGVKRFATSAVFTVFVPALVIVLISLSGLWFPRSELEVRSNATTPMLAAAVLFHFALMQELPATAYLSRADKLMMAVYGCLFLHMVSSWIWFVFDESRTEVIFRWAKYICAPVTLVVMALAIVL
ncbi:MAG: hypothetical protein KF795_29205 [Labilithrix sp.]|nr:hypothetical protein [Labilithrix sp.]